MQGNRERITVTQRLEKTMDPCIVLQASDVSCGVQLADDDQPRRTLGTSSGLILSPEEFVMDRSRIRENVLVHLNPGQIGEGHSMTHPVSTLVTPEVTIVF
jgi:hypothetical protein